MEFKKGYTQALYLLRELVECLSGLLLFQRLEEENDEPERKVSASIVFTTTTG